jgi:pimeloyl-ACP methyl ester carboxylesterase
MYFGIAFISPAILCKTSAALREHFQKALSTMHTITALLNERRLFALLAGAGPTTVVLEAGLAGTADEWAHIQAAVAPFATVISYDRAGLGRSDTALLPRTCPEIIEDLRGLLAAAALRPPYILVAHSWSGINARWYANHYPHELAGLILIDAVHEGKYAQFEQILSEEQAQRMWAVFSDPSKNDEHIDRLASIKQISDKKVCYNFPLIVLTRAAGTDALDNIETSLQAEFLTLSATSKQYFSKFPNHHIHKAEPELVVDAIRELVQMVERNGV